ncbi:hypothetical protein ACJX0J_021611, partial [Zea mays]
GDLNTVINSVVNLLVFIFFCLIYRFGELDWKKGLIYLHPYIQVFINDDILHLT